MADFGADIARFLQQLYATVREMVQREINAVLGNIVKGGKIEASALPVDGTTITITTGGGGGQVISSGGGTVTSIGVTVPTSILTVSPSSITGSGTFAFTLATQIANTVWAGPTTGVAAAPTFRGLVPADIPSLDAAKIATGTFAGARIPVDASTIIISGGVVTGNYVGGTGITISGRTISASGGGSFSFAAQGSLITSDASLADVELPIGRAHQAPSPVIGGAGKDVAWVTPTPAPGYVDRRSNDGDLAVRTIATPGAGAILFIGDSNMAGGGIMTLPTPPDRAVSKLSTLSGLSITAVNWGIGSSYSDNWTPGSGLAPAGWGGGTPILSLAIAAGKAAGARIAWVTIGTNDAYSTVNNSAVTYYAHMLAIVQNLAANGFTVFVGYMDYNRYTGAPYISTPNANYLAYQPYIDKLAIPGQVFVGDTTLWLATKANTGTTGWYADNVHLDYNGEDYWAQVMAEAMLPAVLALYGQSTEQVIPKGANNTFFGVNGSGVQGYYAAPSGLSVAAKGDLQGFNTAPAAVPVSGHNGRVLTEDSTVALGVSWQQPAVPTTALSGLSDVSLRNLADGDSLVWVDVLNVWMNSTALANFGANVVDGGVLVVDSGVQVIEDPLPVEVVDSGRTVVSGGVRVVV